MLQVSRQDYYEYLKSPKSNRQIENEVLINKINEIYHQNKGLYGSPKIAMLLNDKGIFVSKNRGAIY